MAAAEQEEEFGRATPAIKDGRLRITGLEHGIVAGRGPASGERGRAERAVIEVERVSAGEDGPVVGDRGPGTIRSKQSQAPVRLARRRARPPRQAMRADCESRDSPDWGRCRYLP